MVQHFDSSPVLLRSTGQVAGQVIAWLTIAQKERRYNDTINFVMILKKND
jgi:hypothetical protein